ncbi:cytochrome b561 [Sulfurivirga caldicuralii]|uniref:Cytochrome b561 n=1 Tax=Sulfurivirga caldicuralii TaxID=364032 RepID=A0A1N6ER16_9GAMM|nr:cytochrome b [Sulfurivirga caldicuralii]SIN85532.1 cytochrome b561 [Sulfurivirga caldicuralii]
MLWNTRESYGLITRLFHWGIALLFFALFFVGLYMGELDKTDPLRKQLFALHQSVGMLVFLLTLIRIPLSRIQPEPMPPSHMGPWEVQFANAVKKGMNLLLLLIPIAGYLTVTTKGYHPIFFGIEMPILIGENEELHEFFEETHEFLAWTLMAIVVLHMAAAWKHHFIDKDDVLLRMLGRKRPE